MRNYFEEAGSLINDEMCPVYREWYPTEHIVKQSKSLIFHVIQQMGCTFYESKNETHLIVPTKKVYDLITPMEYEHKVMVYSPTTSNFESQFYGREMDCRAFIVKWQSQHYGFSYAKYLEGLAKLRGIESKLDAIAQDGDFDEDDVDQIASTIHLLKGSIRKELGLAEDEDLPALSLEQAIEQSN